jgi:hypothetical protein
MNYLHFALFLILSSCISYQQPKTEAHRIYHFDSKQVEKLLTAGMDPNIKDNFGKNAFFIFRPDFKPKGKKSTRSLNC